MTSMLPRRLLMAGTLSGLAFIVGTSAWLASPSLRGQVDRLRHPGYDPGTYIDAPLPASSGHDRTLVLFVRSSCGVCQAITPDLKRLVATFRDARRARVVVVAHNLDSGINAYAERIGVTHEELLLLTRDKLTQMNVSAVPTMLVVDQDGRVLDSHTGTLTPEVESRIAGMIGS